MKRACFPFFLEHYHGMIGQKENAYFRETPSGNIIIAKYNREKAEKRVPSDKEIAHREKFKQAHDMALAALAEAATRNPLEAAFKAQNKYSTLIGYVTAQMMKQLTD